jgi:hypothetical protein
LLVACEQLGLVSSKRPGVPVVGSVGLRSNPTDQHWHLPGSATRQAALAVLGSRQTPGIRAQASAQSLDELRRPSRGGDRARDLQPPRASASGPLRSRTVHRLGQLGRASRSCSGRNSLPARQSANYRHTRVSGAARCANQFDRFHTPRPLSQECAQFSQQGLDRMVQSLDVRDLGLEVAARSESFAGDEGGARVGHAADGAVEGAQRARLESARKTVAWQLQAITDGTHAHRRE